MTARVGVVVFPGTNCELDVLDAFERFGAEAELLWHGDASTRGVDAVIVPGGFAHGDYLRTGAIAQFSPVMEAVREHAAGGRAGCGHLQRLPGAVRERIAPGCAAEEHRPALPL